MLGRWLGARSRFFSDDGAGRRGGHRGEARNLSSNPKLAVDGAAILFTSPEVEEYDGTQCVLVFHGGDVVRN